MKGVRHNDRRAARRTPPTSSHTHRNPHTPPNRCGSPHAMRRRGNSLMIFRPVHDTVSRPPQSAHCEGELTHVAETVRKPGVNIGGEIAVLPGGAARSAPLLDPADDTARSPGR